MAERTPQVYFQPFGTKKCGQLADDMREIIGGGDLNWVKPDWLDQTPYAFLRKDFAETTKAARIRNVLRIARQSGVRMGVIYNAMGRQPNTDVPPSRYPLGVGLVIANQTVLRPEATQEHSGSYVDYVLIDRFDDDPEVHTAAADCMLDEVGNTSVLGSFRPDTPHEPFGLGLVLQDHIQTGPLRADGEWQQLIARGGAPDALLLASTRAR